MAVLGRGGWWMAGEVILLRHGKSGRLKARGGGVSCWLMAVEAMLAKAWQGELEHERVHLLPPQRPPP